MQLINIKNSVEYIKQYVEMRNLFTQALLTESVNVENTKRWLNKTDSRVLGLVAKNLLKGVVIIYPQRNFEIAVFAAEERKGIGTSLLEIAEIHANKLGSNFIWAWVRNDNFSAQRCFINSNYAEEGRDVRQYNGHSIKGVIFTKSLL